MGHNVCPTCREEISTETPKNNRVRVQDNPGYTALLHPRTDLMEELSRLYEMNHYYLNPQPPRTYSILINSPLATFMEEPINEENNQNKERKKSQIKRTSVNNNKEEVVDKETTSGIKPLKKGDLKDINTNIPLPKDISNISGNIYIYIYNI